MNLNIDISPDKSWNDYVPADSQIAAYKRDPEVEDLGSWPKKLRKQLKCCFKLLTFVVSCYRAIDN